MKITFKMIIDYITEDIGVRPLHLFIQESKGICSVDMYRSIKEYADNCLYVSSSSLMERKRTSLLNLICPSDEEPVIEKNITEGNLAIFPTSVSKRQLINSARSALMFYHEWNNHILDMIYKGAGLNEIITFSRQIFKNPILIYDSSMSVLAYSKEEGLAEKFWVDTIKDDAIMRMNNEDTIELLKYINKLDTTNKPFKHKADGLDCPFYSCNILLNGARVGMVCMTERYREITPGYQDLLENLCYLLSFEFQKEFLFGKTGGDAYNQLIIDLIKGRIKKTYSIKSRMASLQWKLSANIRVLSFELVNAIVSESELHTVFKRITSLELNGKGIIYENRLFFIVSSNSSTLSEGYLDNLEIFCNSNRLRCGISDTYCEILDTANMLNQTILALEYSDDTIALFETVRFKNLLNYCNTHPQKSEIYNPMVAWVDDYDQKNQTDFLNTLRLYFNNNRNQVLAADALHIHRTTMFYRLQKIENLCGIDFNDAQEMMHIQLTLYLWDCRSI